MKHERFELKVRYGLENGGFIPSVTTYIIENSCAIDEKRRRPLILICPGGGYAYKSPREAESVAIKMNALGFHAAVLDYSVAPMEFPAAFLDLCEAMNFVRCHADEWNVLSECIFCLL